MGPRPWWIRRRQGIRVAGTGRRRCGAARVLGGLRAAPVPTSVSPRLGTPVPVAGSRRVTRGGRGGKRPAEEAGTAQRITRCRQEQTGQPILPGVVHRRVDASPGADAALAASGSATAQGPEQVPAGAGRLLRDATVRRATKTRPAGVRAAGERFLSARS